MKIRSLLLVVCALLVSACTPRSAESPTPVAAPTIAPATAAPVDPTPIPIGGDPTAIAPATPAPVATPRPVTGGPAASGDDELAALAADRPLRDPVALAKALGACRATPDACPSVARSTPLEVAVGDMQLFYVTDTSSNTQNEIQAELRYAGPVALMYVEQGLPYDQGDLERAARAFEQEIYPRTREIFGSEAQPGVDGDLRITILNARDPSGGVLGYFSSQDSVPRQINRYSNEREMFFMNIELLDFGSPAYLDTLSHEFQHMIHQNEQAGSAIWLNEGASQLSEDLNGYQDPGFTTTYLESPDLQLNNWATGPGQSFAHYGAAHLFMRYIYAQYAGEAQLRPLIRADAGDNLQAFVDLAATTRPDVTSFSQLVADWAVANLIDDRAVGDGRYTYATGTGLADLLPERVLPEELFPGASESTDVAQFGADYYALPEGTRGATFRGATSVPLAAEKPMGQYAWWSARSDDSVATLTRAFDLRGLAKATLQFSTLYEIENDFDYAFVTVSTDGGVTWETLPGTLTTADDPQGVNFGHGITGISGQPGATTEDPFRAVWADERMDLSPYAGQEILLRFWQVNDQAFNAPGMFIDDLSIPELSYSDDVEAGDGSWQADGFVRVDGDLPQRWELRLVRTAADGVVTVEPIAVDQVGAASATLGPGERGVIVIVAATPHTSERAPYELTVE